MALFEAQGNIWGINWTLLSFGDCFFYADQVLSARDYLQKALVLAQQRADPHAHAWALTCLGRVAHAQDDHAQARHQLDISLQVFRDLNDPQSAAHVVLELGRVAEAQGLTAQAYRYYAESLTIFARLRMQRVPECLEGVASLSAGQQPTHAAQLLGAAAVIRESVNVPLSPVHRAAYERTVATARDKIGATVYAAAWAAGRMLTLEQALEMARDVADNVAER